MKIRVLDLLLMLLILAGSVMAWRSGRERNLLAAEYRRLLGKTGELTVIDPTRVHVRAIPTGDPRSFAWRVYVPPNYKEILRRGGGGGSTSTSSDAREFIARVRFREDARGRTRVYTRFGSGSSEEGLTPNPLFDLARVPWDRLEVEQIGSTGPAMLDPDRSVVFLELKVPASLLAGRSPPAGPLGISTPTLYRLEFGPEGPNP